LGYHFNPVSFWYLYTADKQLAAMILEVNNTFDERRIYFLPRGELPLERQIPGDQAEREGASVESAESSAATRSNPTAKFRQSWPKDFHVSPFNSRKGFYSLLAHDPWNLDKINLGRVENAISLESSKGHAKLEARLFSDGEPVDPTTMGAFAKLKFLVAWWWVGFVTFPRIVKEAGLLFFRRNLHVWYRPEPLKESIGRKADATERRLETAFRCYLRHLVEQATANIVVKYKSSGIDDGEAELMPSRAAQRQPKRAEGLEFKVLTPAFYARFVHYAHDFEAMFCEFTDNSTIWISKPDLLPKLVFKKPLPPLKAGTIQDFVYFKAIQKLRRRPERIVQALTSSATPTPPERGVDIRELRISSMDGFVLSQKDSKLRRTYMSDVLRLFMSERLSLGSGTLLGLEHLVLRTGMAWVLSHSVGTWIISLLIEI
jgi:Protein of unknown function (DUF1365)